MSQPFNPEGPIGIELKKNLIAELINKFNIAEDAEDVAEYIIVLIVSNKTVDEVVSEVKEIADVPIDENFVNSIYQEINRLITLSNTSQQPAQTQELAQAPQPQPQSQPAELTESIKPTQADQQPQDSIQIVNLPSGPRGLQQRNNHHHTNHQNSNNNNQFGNNKFNNRGGINKGSKNGFKKSFAIQNAQNFEKILSMSNANVTNIKPFVQKPSKGRCIDFPYCNNKDCQFSHPTKTCFAFPNCTNAPGTCNYLHPGEDDELMAKLEKSKQEYREKKRIEATGTIGICKYGILCSKELCPFGHPTPANREAKVLILQWCSSGKRCEDFNCTKAHPSPNYQAPPPEPKPKPSVPKIEPTLEQCKFGPACTNYKCPRRHATSLVPCREGRNCTRLDCFFSHPIDEDCRFAAQCKNKNCMFRHPQGREIQSNTWSKNSGSMDSSTNERVFAVPEDQIMEQAIQES